MAIPLITGIGSAPRNFAMKLVQRRVMNTSVPGARVSCAAAKQHTYYDNSSSEHAANDYTEPSFFFVYHQPLHVMALTAHICAV